MLTAFCNRAAPAGLAPYDLRHTLRDMSTATLIPLLMAAARRRLVASLRTSGALNPDRAIELSPKTYFDQDALKRLLLAGVVIETPEKGRFYLDESKLTELIQRENKVTLITLAITLAACLLAAVIFACFCALR